MPPIEYLYYGTGILTSLLALLYAIVRAVKVMHRITHAVGADKNGRTVVERLERVEHQLWENGGSSLADRVNSIEKHVVHTAGKLDVIEGILVGSNNASEPIIELKPKRSRKKSEDK